VLSFFIERARKTLRCALNWEIKKEILGFGLQGNILPAFKIIAYPTYNSFADQLEIMRGESIES